MIALRKDVKVGFGIGGVALGVFGVYLALSALAGPRPDSSMTGANLQLTPFGASKETTTVATRTPANQLPAVPQKSPTQTANNVGPAMANPSQQVTITETNTGDIWGSAFETGKIQPAVTVTPDGSKSGGNAPKPSEVISAINQPQGGSGSGSASKPKPDTTQTPDPSGSMLDLTKSTLTKASESTSSSTTASGSQTHTIEVGETLSSISTTYYGDAKYFKMLVDANPQVDPNKLKPGMVIKVPVLAKKDPKSDTTDVPALSKIDPAKQYVVKTGDSLNRIASTLYGDSTMWQKIYDLNKSTIGDSPAKLKLGMVLNLPSPPTHVR